MNELIYTLIVTHITIVCVTLYLHRGQAHRAIEFHPIAAHFMRAWLWLTTGMITQQWVAIHRKHHRFTDSTGDPHSPHVYGICKVFFKGAWLYNEAAKDKIMVSTYGSGCPTDWVERNLYSAHSRLGIGLVLVLNTWLWGWWGPLIWLIQMAWIPFWAAGVVNGVGHWWGYRNGITKDNSRNISPWGIVIGGEELHNNHHLNPASARLSRRWWELDLGWIWFRFFSFLGLMKLRQ